MTTIFIIYANLNQMTAVASGLFWKDTWGWYGLCTKEDHDRWEMEPERGKLWCVKDFHCVEWEDKEITWVRNQKVFILLIKV